MRCLKSKRGSWQIEILKPVFELILIFLIIFLPLLYFANSFSTVQGYEKIFLAKDIGLLVDTMYVGQGKTTLTYPENTSQYSVDFKTNKVQVYDIDNLLLKGGFQFSEDSIVEFVHREIPPIKNYGQLIFEKSDKLFTVNRQSELMAQQEAR